MTSTTPKIDHPEVSRLNRAGQPRAFAILRDHDRRGGVRVVRVAVVTRWDQLSTAEVAELRTGRHHVLHFGHLSSRCNAGLRAKIRAQVELSLFPPRALGFPAASSRVATGAGALS